MAIAKHMARVVPADLIPDCRCPERIIFLNPFMRPVYEIDSHVLTTLTPTSGRRRSGPGRTRSGGRPSNERGQTFGQAAVEAKCFTVTISSPALRVREYRVTPTASMGIADRDYHRNQPTDGGSGFLPRLTPVVKYLLIANIGIFILDYLVLPRFYGIKIDGALHLPPLLNWGAFTVHSAIMEHRLWEFITFQFLHDGLAHIMFNSIGLFFFGPWMERWWGPVKFLIFYLLCGIAGAAFYMLLMFLKIVPGDIGSYLVGASAGIYGIFIGVAFIAPDLRVTLLIPPVELTMRQVAIGLLIISTGAILLSLGGNEGGEAGHLGGAILGYVLMRWPGLLGKGRESNIIRPRAFKPKHQAKLRPRSDAHIEQANEVDLILDKISREGTHSLTQAERDLLLKASERQKP